MLFFNNNLNENRFKLMEENDKNLINENDFNKNNYSNSFDGMSNNDNAQNSNLTNNLPFINWSPKFMDLNKVNINQTENNNLLNQLKLNEIKVIN